MRATENGIERERKPEKETEEEKWVKQTSQSKTYKKVRAFSERALYEIVERLIVEKIRAKCYREVSNWWNSERAIERNRTELKSWVY